MEVNWILNINLSMKLFDIKKRDKSSEERKLEEEKKNERRTS